MQEAKLHLVRTKQIPNPHYYIRALEGEFRDYAFNEERAMELKGQWRQQAFRLQAEHPMDLEIGTGNGFFFAHQAAQSPDRALLGVELKFKPLIQSIRRALREGCQNARIMRFDARHLEKVFEEGEVDNVFLHFPDPWIKRRWFKNRLINQDFLKSLFKLQKPGRFLEFKTDSRDYYDWAMKEFEMSDYRVEERSLDLHNSEFAQKNFVTHFEKIFIQQNIPINYALLRRT